MKREDLYDAITDVRDELVEEAGPDQAGPEGKTMAQVGRNRRLSCADRRRRRRSCAGGCCRGWAAAAGAPAVAATAARCFSPMPGRCFP